jgi:hypothetical protein
MCQAEYPRQCTNGAGSANYQCKTDSLSPPDWAGVFNIANRCDARICCCPTGQLILSRVNGNELRMQCRFTGEECEDFLSLDQTIAMPGGYSLQIGFLGSPILVTLSQDSHSIQLTNQFFSICSETAIRADPSVPSSTGTAPINNALSTVTNNLTLLFLLSSLMSVKRFKI